MNKETAIILELDNLVKYYGSGDNLVRAVDHTSLQIERGKFTAIVGRSGSGKSTLLHILLAQFRRKKIGFIFQDYNLIPALNVWENVVLPLGLDNRKVNRQEVEQILKKIGIEDKKSAMPNVLSGGQKQRTAIARALVTKPAIILADEPTGNLDSQTELEVISLLKKCVQDFGQTLVMITHDETIAQMADRIIAIEDGRAVN